LSVADGSQSKRRPLASDNGGQRCT
jgi:hypothetical protein